MGKHRDQREVEFIPHEGENDDEDGQDGFVWEVRTCTSPGELEVVLNQLSQEGWDIWSIYDRMAEWVIVAYSEE